jgi:hypothetical protein
MRSGTVSWPGYRRSPIRQPGGLDACDKSCSGKDAKDDITGEHGYCYTEDDSDTDYDRNQQSVARQIRSRHRCPPSRHSASPCGNISVVRTPASVALGPGVVASPGRLVP